MTHLAIPTLAFCAALATTPAIAAQQATANLSPLRDNSIYQFDPNVSNGAGSRLFCGNDFAATPKRALIAFDVAGSIPSGSTIVSARLELSVAQTLAPDLPVTVHRLSNAWGEGTSVAGAGQGGGAPATPGDATWSHAFFQTTPWQSAGGDFVATASASTICGSTGRFAWTSSQLTADVQAWLDTPAGDHGWIVLSRETGVQTARALHSREAAAVADRPELIVTYTPPAASVRSFGNGCPGGGAQALGLTANGLPSVPNPGFALLVAGGPSNGLAIVDYFGALLPNPIPLGHGCFLWGDVSLLFDGVSTNGTTPLPVPNDRNLLGATLGVQAFSIDPATLAIAASNGLELHLGL